jgi:hypothetical protein
MKKYRVYIGIIIVLAILAIVLYMNDKSGTLKVGHHEFSVADTSSITTVKISDGTVAISLERQGDKWTVNNGYYARAKAVRALLRVVSSIEVSSPVPKSMMNDVLDGFNGRVVSVTIESSGQVIKAFRIAENDSLQIGSFAMLTGDNVPYVVRMAGYDGHVSKLFPIEPLFWRDKMLFSYRLSDILSVEVEYLQHPENSFAYQFLGPGDLKIKSLATNKTIPIDKARARDYLLNFSSLPFQVAEMMPFKINYDSLIFQKPFCEIKVKNTGNQIKTVKTYRMPDLKKSGSYDINFMYALVQDDKMPVIVKYIDLDPIMRKYSDFVSK